MTQVPAARPADALLAGVDWDAITQRPPFALQWDAIRAHVGGRVVLVTGAAGSLGSPLTQALALAGAARLVLLDHHEGSLFHLRQALATLPDAPPVRAVLADVRGARRVGRVFDAERPDLVFHLAAYKHVPWGEEDPEAFLEANVLGGQVILDAARAAGTARIVYPSTDKAIDPPSLYGATKRVVEAMLYAAAETGGPACSVVRFVNVLGSRGSAPETFARLLAAGRSLTVNGGPAMRRYWITPDHARLLLLHAACVDERAVTVVPDAGDEIAVLEIARRLAAALYPDRPAPQIAVAGMRPGERLAEPLAAAHERLETLPLPGLLAARGGARLDPHIVDEVVTGLLHLIDGPTEPSPEAVRAALFDAARRVQSRPAPAVHVE